MPYRDVCEIANQLDNAIVWLNDRGIRIPVTGRFHEYQRTLNQACRARLAGINNQEAAPPPDLHELFTALCEASDIWQIRHLPEDQIEQNAALVQRLINGTSSYTTAPQHDPGRDTQFELMTASLFARGGATIELGKPADVMTIIGHWPVAIECKRPTTIPALRSRIEDAYRQFRRHDEHGLNAVRIIAIDLSVLLNPNFDVLIAQTNSHASELIDDHMRQLFERASEELDRANRNTGGRVRIDAFLFRMLCVVAHPTDGMERIGEFWRVTPLIGPERQAWQALDEIVAMLPGFGQF